MFRMAGGEEGVRRKGEVKNEKGREREGKEMGVRWKEEGGGGSRGGVKRVEWERIRGRRWGKKKKYGGKWKWKIEGGAERVRVAEMERRRKKGWEMGGEVVRKIKKAER